MPAPASIDEFLDLVQKSGVLEKSRLDDYVRGLKAAGTLPPEPGKLAGLLVRDALLTFFQAEQILQGKWKRFFLGKYKVLEKLGSGGMGQVFLCEHKLMKRRVAVKVLPTAKAADPSSLARFVREARAIAALDHPNIVRAYDIDQDENLHFLVMEFVDGPNLQDLVKKFGPLDVLRACHYAYGSAIGLQYAFDMGIVHRDIKPANVLVDRAGVVKILDMGLARFFNDEDHNLTRKYDENVLGTADYLAPEQAVDSHVVDIRADIYSLGGTLYYLLSGLPPFPEGSVAQKLLWHQTRDPKPVRAIRPGVPEGVAGIVAKMMAKEPADRYATPGELMAALAPWVQTPIPPPSERELPQFSPAAVGQGAGSRPAVSGVMVAWNGSAPPPPAGASQAPTVVAHAPSTGKPVTGKPAPAPPAAPPPPPADAPGGIWESLASETRPNAHADTGDGKRPAVRPTRRPPPPAADAPAAGRRRVGLAVAVAVAVGGLIALAVAVYAVYRLITPTGPPPKKPVTEARTWFVARDGGHQPADQTRPNLFAAVNVAHPGDRIVLLDDLITDDPIKLDGSKFGLGHLTIEAGNAARSVRWVPSGGDRSTPVLTVADLEGVRVRGLVIDAGGRFDTGVAVVGVVPGLAVEDVTVRNPRREGFRLTTARGEAGRSASLTRVRVSAEAPFDAGVVFAGDARSATRHARLKEGRVDGPAKAGVRVVGAADDVEVLHTRVYNVEAGVAFDAPAPESVPLGVRLVGNTFHTVREAGVRAGVKFPAHLANRVLVAQNFFAKTTALATVPGGKLTGLDADTNARDAESHEGNVPLGAVEVAAPDLNSNPADDGFLLYGPAGPLNAVGPNQLPVGVPPPPQPPQ